MTLYRNVGVSPLDLPQGQPWPGQDIDLLDSGAPEVQAAIARGALRPVNPPEAAPPAPTEPAPVVADVQPPTEPAPPDEHSQL